MPAPAPGQPTARGATADSGRHGPTPLLITFFPRRRARRCVLSRYHRGRRRKLGDAARSADTGPVRAQPDGSGATDAQRLRRSNRRILRPGKYGASAGVARYSESSIHLSDLRFSHMCRRGPVRWRRHFWPLTAADCSPSTYRRRPAIRSLSIRRFTVRRWTFAAFAELAGRSVAKPRARAGLSDSTSDTVYTLVVSGG